MEQRQQNDEGSIGKQHRVGFVNSNLQSPKMQAEFNIIDRFYKLMLSSSQTNQQLIQVFAYSKKNKAPNTSIIVQRLTKIKNQINDAERSIQSRQSQLRNFEQVILHLDLIPKLYMRYLERMRRRLFMIGKHKQYLPDFITKNQESFDMLYKLPAENNQDLNHYSKLIKYLQVQNKHIYNALIEHLVQNNILVSIEEFDALGISKIVQQPEILEDEIVFSRQTSKEVKKKSKKNKVTTNQDVKKIFIYEGYENIKDDNQAISATFEQSLIRMGELEIEVSSHQMKDIQYHVSEIEEINKVGKNIIASKLLKLQSKKFLQVVNQKHNRSRKVSINQNVEQPPYTPSNSQNPLKSTMTIIKLKSKKRLDTDEGSRRKINQYTQAEDPCFTKRNNSGGSKGLFRKTNRFTLTMKKPEIFIHQFSSKPTPKRTTTLQAKQNKQLKKVQSYDRDSRLSHNRIQIQKQRKRQRKSSNELLSNMMIQSCRVSKNHKDKQEVLNKQQKDQPKQVKKGLANIQKCPLLIQQSSHQMIFKPQRIKNLKRNHKSNIVSTLATQANQNTEIQASLRTQKLIEKLKQKQNTLPLNSLFILQSKKISKNYRCSLNIIDQNFLMPKLLQYDRSSLTMQPYLKTLRDRMTRRIKVQRFPSQSSKIYEIYSPRTFQMITK